MKRREIEPGAIVYVEYLADGIPVGIYGKARRAVLSDRLMIDGVGTDDGVTVDLGAVEVVECYPLGEAPV